MDYVRVDLNDCYIYLENNTPALDGHWRTPQYRAKELLKKSIWRYKRVKRMSKLPMDKKVNVWYNKSTKSGRQ